MTLAHLDRQLRESRTTGEAPALPDRVWDHLATTIHDEVIGLGEEVTNQLRISIPIPPSAMSTS